MRRLPFAIILCSIWFAGATAPSISAGNGMMMSPRDRGMYIVTSIGMCMDCHGADLQGGTIPFAPVPGVHIPWAKTAPGIARLPMFKTDAAAVRFFETGLLPNGTRARPPMPQYRLKSEDAQAVVMYLRSR